jgi:hypothetical protein
MNRTKEFLWFLFLTNLDGPGVSFKYVGQKTIKANSRDRKVESILREKAGEAPIELMIGENEGRTVLFGLSRKIASGKTEQVAFSVHHLVRGADGAALVPLVAEYREDGQLTFEARAGENSIKLNPALEDRLFAMPR